MNYFKKFGKCKYDLNDKSELAQEINSHYEESKVPLFQTKIFFIVNFYH